MTAGADSFASGLFRLRPDVAVRELTVRSAAVYHEHRVPTESDTASTTALKVQVPTDTPIAFVLVLVLVLVQPHPG
jgi:hypothetical protein